MPQKKNPDAAELARGKAGRLIGNLTGLLATLKGLPFAYNRDLQEDKEPVFDTVTQLSLVLPAMTGTMATLVFDKERMGAEAHAGFALATDIAEWLVQTGDAVPPGARGGRGCVQVAEARGVELHDLTDEELVSVSPMLTPAVRQVLDVKGALASRNSTGGTAPEQVLIQVAGLKEQIAARQN